MNRVEDEFERDAGNISSSMAEANSPDSLADEDKPIDATWENEPASGLQFVMHRNEMNLQQLGEFLSRLQFCFDRGLEENQMEILRHRVGRLSAKKEFHGYYSVLHDEVMTNLEVIIEHQLRGMYMLVLRGIGPAMEVMREELERFQPQAPAVTPAPVPELAPVTLAVPAPVAKPASAPVKAAKKEIPADGIMRMTSDRLYWRTLLPLSRGNVLGQPIFVMVENKRQGNRMQPQQADHELLEQIYGQLTYVIEQVVNLLYEHIDNHESLRTLTEPMICIYAERDDPQSWTFFLTQTKPEPEKLAMQFRGVELVV